MLRSRPRSRVSCVLAFSLSLSLRCKLKKLINRARPLQARATPDDEGQGEGKGSHDGSPRQVDDERLTLSHLNQLSRRLDRRSGHSFGNHASHGGAQRELSGHKARFWLVSNALQTRTRARIQTPITTLGRLSREHRGQHAPSHVSPSLKHPHRRIRDAVRAAKPPRARDFIHSTASIRSHARDRRRRASRARKPIAHRSHTRMHIVHIHRTRAVCNTPMRQRATTPRSLARDRCSDPETPPTRVHARAHRAIRATSRTVLARIDAMREFPTHPHRARSPSRRRTQRPRRRARRDGVLSSRPRLERHRIASHRIACVPYPREGPRRRA